MKNVCLALALGAAVLMPAHAQSGGKRETAQKIVQMQQPAIEGLARQMVELPAAQLMQQAGPVLQQRVAADKRESVAQDIQADVRRYVDDTLPVVRDRAVKLSPEVVVPILEAKLSEEELRQVLQIMQQMDSPVMRKYNALGPDIQRALTEKLVAETRSAVDPKLKTLQDNMAKRLGVPAPGASAPARKN